MSGSGDYISREAAEKVFSQPVTMSMCLTLEECKQKNAQRQIDLFVIRGLPAADVRSVVRGKWENNHCSACGMMPMGEEIWECCDFAPPKFEWFMNYCPNCGAWMEES